MATSLRDDGSKRDGSVFKKRIPVNSVRLLCVLAVLCLGSNLFAVGSDAGTIKGTVRAVASGATSTLPTTIAGATLTLVNKATPGQSIKTFSNASGNFIFDSLPAGDYILTIEAAGLLKVSKEIRVDSGAMLSLEIDLTATVSASVTVHDEEGLLSTSNTTTSNIVRMESLKTQPLRTDNYQNAIQLTPGSVRDGNGNDYIKGTRAGQSGYTVNGADVTDPVTGKLAFDIPLEAAQSVQIEENPYSAEFGRFTGGVINLQTKGGGDKFKIGASRFFPTFHNIFSAKIDSFRPRVTLGGPIIAKRLFFLQSFEYRFSRIFVPSLPKPKNESRQEGVNSFTQLDLNINKSNVLKFNAALFPQRFRNLGLDTFNPAAATPNYKQRGMLLSISEQAVFKNASFASSEISYKTFDVDVFAQSSLPFTIAPQTNSGGYFADTRRQTKRIQWQESYYTRPLKFHGKHSIKTGFEIDHTKVTGQLRFKPIFIRRQDQTLAQRIDFTNVSPINYVYQEYAAFVQDKWTVTPKLTVDVGLRFDHDGVAKSNNVAPRFSFMYWPLRDQRTIIRGGIGTFYDRSLSTGGYFDSDTTDGPIDPAAEFGHIPRRIVTTYAADGVTVIEGPRRFRHHLAMPLRTPRSVRWNIQIDRGITENLTARVGFLERETKNDLIIEPIMGSGSTARLRLSSGGRSHYDELQFLLVYNQPKVGQWNASYVFSHARGDLNSSDKFFGDTPAFVVRPNEYASLPFESPHRFLLYGQIDISKKYEIRVSPLFEIRTGFPFSKINEMLDFVGKRNSSGRFPPYVSIDLQVTKRIKLPFVKDKHVRLGVAVLNLTNHFNPRDVQNNVGSPNYGRFYNSLGTSLKAKFDFGN